MWLRRLISHCRNRHVIRGRHPFRRNELLNVDGRMSSTGCLFSPPPLIREAAEASAWGGHPVVVSRPPPLADRTFSPDRLLNSEIREEALRPLLLVTSRISRVRSLPFRSVLCTHTASPLDDLKPLSISAGTSFQALLRQLAAPAGLTTPTLRSDRAWVGGSSPQKAQIALPAVHHLPDLLEDFTRLLHRWQGSPNEVISEALAYQYLAIHPLSDGNGRIIRALLARLAARTLSIYPVYIAWRLKFDGVRCFNDWTAAALSGRATLSTGHFEHWRLCATAFGEVCAQARSHGFDQRALDTWLTAGVVNDRAIASLLKSRSDNLSRKIADHYNAPSLSDARASFELGIEAAIRACTELFKGR